jgi:hypothetical protein
MKRLVLLLPLLLLLTGCNDPYGVAAKLAQDVAVSVNQADITIDQFRVAGSISVDEERTILGYLASLNTIDGTYISCVQAAHASATKVGGFTACASSLAAAMGNPATLAAIHVSNPESQAKVTAVVQGITTLVETTITALGGK